jgi:hypothetical protein
MPAPHAADDDLAGVRQAILVLAEVQNRVLDAIQAQGVRYDGLNQALMSLEGQVAQLREAVAHRFEGNDLKGLVSEIGEMNEVLVGMTVTTREVGDGIARLADLLRDHGGEVS